MGKMVLCLVLFCTASQALAQIDPDPNGIGIYFDEEAFIYCMTAPFGVNRTAYLCLTRASDHSGISAWEAMVEVSQPSAVLSWNLRGQATNTSVPPEFMVQMAEPLPWQSSLVLMEIEINIGTAHPVVFRIHPVSEPTVTTTPFPLPAYAGSDDPSDYKTLGYSWGWDPLTGIPNWCAVINPAGDCGDDPTETENTSWGGIKALYH